MIDPIAATMVALTSRSPATVGLVFVSGVVTSVGPCIAPRYVAVAAIINGAQRPLVATCAFVLGLVGAFMALGFVAGFLGTLWSLSSAIDTVLAIGLIGGGCMTLVRAAPDRTSAHGCAGHIAARSGARSLGAIFLLGMASAFVVSPCCTPILAAVVATSSAMGQPLIGMVLLCSFGAGHALPLFFTGSIGSVAQRIMPLQLPLQAPAIIGGILMMALGLYYGVLA